MNYLKTVIITAIFFIISAGSALSFPIDLTKQDIYIRKGFQKEWVSELPEDNSWKKIPGSKTGMRKITIMDADLPGTPRRASFTLKYYKPQLFTYCSVFTLNESHISINKIPGLYFAYFGGNREIYINGSLIHKEWHVNDDGSIQKIVNIRNLLIPIDPRVLTPGKNILTIKLYGDPTYVTTGFYHAKPYRIDDLDILTKMESETLTLVLIFTYFLFGLYYIFIYLYRAEEKEYLFLGFFAIVLFLYHYTRTRAVYSIIPDINILDRLELVCLYLLLPLFMSFMDRFLFRKTGFFVKIVWIFNLILIVLTIPTTLPFTYDIQMVWHTTVVIPLGYIVFFQVGYKLIGVIKEQYLLYSGQTIPDQIDDIEHHGKDKTRVFFLAVKYAFIRTHAGGMFFCAIIMVACAVFDNIDRIYFHIGLDIAKYGFISILLIVAFIQAKNFMHVHNQIRSLNLILEQKITDLEDARDAIAHSEEKYSLLIESSESYIFTSDIQGNLLTANKSLRREQRIGSGKLNNLNIGDLLFEEQVNTNMARQLMADKIKECVSSNKMSIIRTKFKSITSNEPKEMLVQLEYITTGKRNEILGRASALTEDTLLKYLNREDQEYAIASHFTIAEELTHRLVKNAKKYFSPSKITLLRLSLREILINAIEHGNLEISYDEKTDLSVDGDYLAYIEQKQGRPEFKNRKVSVDYRLGSDRITYIITDEGKGFDCSSIINSHKNKANTEMLGHGRGIIIAVNFFDAVEYNESGNSVKLVKIFERV
ncbi:MAG: ATP-binding protein [bacterium]|nr:ATP-binding protein [bacterium]